MIEPHTETNGSTIIISYPVCQAFMISKIPVSSAEVTDHRLPIAKKEYFLCKKRKNNSRSGNYSKSHLEQH